MSFYRNFPNREYLLEELKATSKNFLRLSTSEFVQKIAFLKLHKPKITSTSCTDQMRCVGVFCHVVTSCSGARPKIRLSAENSFSYVNSLLCCDVNMESMMETNKWLTYADFQDMCFENKLFGVSKLTAL